MKNFLHKCGQLLFLLVPIIITLAIQVGVIIPVSIYYFAGLGFSGQIPTGEFDIFQWIQDVLLSSDYSIFVSTAWGCISLAVFYVWYKRKHDKSEDIPVKKTLTKFGCAGIILMVVGLQIAIQYVYTLIEIGLPSIFKTYNQMMEMSSGSTTLGAVVMLVYSILIAPIHEEFLNRGVVLYYAKKAMPFWLANIVQAALFGALHMNLVQGSYAFIAGLVLGYIYKQSRNIVVPIIFHILFNLFGTIAPLMPLNTTAMSAYLFVGGLGIVVALGGMVLFNASTQMREE